MASLFKVKVRIFADENDSKFQTELIGGTTKDGASWSVSMKTYDEKVFVVYEKSDNILKAIDKVMNSVALDTHKKVLKAELFGSNSADCRDKDVFEIID